MLVCNGAPQNIYGKGPRKAIIRPWTEDMWFQTSCPL